MARKIIDIACCFLCFLLIIPLILAVSSSLSNRTHEIVLLPSPVSFGQYMNLLLVEKGFWRGLFNTLILTVIILPLQLIICVISGYTFARRSFPGKRILWIIYIFMMLLPFESTILPNYLLMKKTGFYGTWYSIILPMIVLPMPTVLMRGFIQAIDNCCYDEFSMNCANRFKLYFYVIIPMVSPGLSAVAMLLIAELWSMIELPMAMLSDIYSYPLATLFGNERLSRAVTVNFAGTVCYVIPILFICLVFGKKIIGGFEKLQLKQEL